LLAGFSNDFHARNNTISDFYQSGELVKLTNVGDIERNRWQHGMANLNLRHKFTDAQNVSLDIDYLRYNNAQRHDYVNHFDFLTENRTANELLRSNKTTPIAMWVFKGDFEQTLGAKSRLELGAKTTLMGLTNDVWVERQQQNVWQIDGGYSQNYRLDDIILAGYANLHQTLSAKTMLQAGLRYEHTDTDIGPPDEPLVVRRRYGSLFPSVFLSHEFGKSTSVQISYSRRVQRPSYDLLAPWILFTSPYAFVTGNPNLLPTFTDAVQATYRFHESYLLTVKYSHDRNALDRYRVRIDSVTNRTYVTPQNVASFNTVSMTFSFPLKLTNWWQLQTNILAVWQSLSTVVQEKPVQLQNYNANLFTTHSFNLSHGFTAELTTFYQTPNLVGISKVRSQTSVNAGIRKKMSGKAGAILLNISDIFWTNRMRVITTNPAVGHVGTWSYVSEPRVVRLTYSRNFGSQRVKTSNRRATGSEDERSRVLAN
jgi:hypothetical protein